MKTEILIGRSVVGDAALERVVSEYGPRLARHRRLAVLASSRSAYVAALALARAGEQQLLIIPTARSLDDVRGDLVDCGVTVVIKDWEAGRLVFEEQPGDVSEFVEPGVLIFTSGSTGRPKLVAHRWDTIDAAAKFVPERLAGDTWLLAYEPASYAGLQVYFSATACRGKLVIPSEADRQNYAALIAETGVTVISATPTWWRMLINSWPTGVAPPRLSQATLGGELVSQSIIDMVDLFFRPERITHIYASTEAGTAIVVSDRLEGFPVTMLKEDGDVGLRLRDGLLQVRSKRSMAGYLGGVTLEAADEWIATADRVEVRGDRCFFAGRQDGQINVGGMKVQPEEVEQALLDFPDIDDCAVYARRSPITGALLAADIVRTGSDVTAEALRTRLAEKLPRFKIPQHIRFVGQVDVSDHGKKLRR
jgi:acyl-coenzyme A synthetase/AMP-(fatty) acid ligase